MNSLYQKTKKIAAITAMVTAAIFYSQSLEAQDKKPNIVFIYMDDLGWTDVASGSKYYETPQIDALAKQSLVFTQAYSVGPNCAPSRASLMTGKYTPRHGVFTVGTSERGDSTKRKLIPVKSNPVLNPAFTTIAEELKNAGYQTSLIGKWQLGGKKQGADAHAQGFDHVIAGSPGTPSYFYPYTGKGNKEKAPHEGITEGKEGEYLTDRLTDEALKFITENKEKPFFLYLSYFAVHTPIQGKPEKVSKFKAKKGDEYHNNPTYAAMLESADEGVGRVLNELKKLNLEENTIVVFYSDNGGYGGATAQPPLRGSKGMLYEGGVRVPLFVRWPGKVKPGTRTDSPVIGVDFYPTLLQIANVSQPLNTQLDGKTFLPVLLGQPAVKRDAIFWHFPAYLEGYNADKRHKDIFRTRPVSAIRSGDYKLLEFYEDHRVELYNIKEDIGETNDLAVKLPEKKKELYDKLQQWKKDVKAPVPTQPNPLYKP
ncbi:sulfatase [Desertivirga arenae]|uniref:sulfatase n=1 Tax=Desertivirga arenae TaxID=2810309 RepID=UPI001A97A6BE|nr:sulfatase [Pedobacter sp. SYSU D00823]